MSWYTDPHLFIYTKSIFECVYRIKEIVPIGTTFTLHDFTDSDADCYDFSKHLSLGYNEESDYDSFFEDLWMRPAETMINSQGLVATPDCQGNFYMAREDLDKPFYSLPTYLPAWVAEQDRLIAEKQALEKIVSESETMISTYQDKEKKLTAVVSYLQEQLDREKKISKLTSKL